MTSVLVTGASGFIGKNLCSHLELNDGIEVIRYDTANTERDLDSFIDHADFIFHLAGINRPKDEKDFTTGNKELTEKIIDLLRARDKRTPFLVTSSIQAELDNPYGKSKLAVERAAFDWHKESGSPVYVYRLPGIFGKWCRPNYNSVVATFCNNIANGIPIEISDPSHVVTLAYIDDVVDDFAGHLDGDDTTDYAKHQLVSRTFDVSLQDLSDRIHALRDIRTNLIVPNLSDQLNKFLYATYVSYLKADDFSYNLTKNTDQRGWLAEFVKSREFGQVFISKTKSGISRGDHWHKTKIEKFLVIEGRGEITFRNKINDQDIIRYTVEGDEMKVIDIPVGYVHAIRNTGDRDLITIFWANEMLDKEKPDTFYEKVEQGDRNE